MIYQTINTFGFAYFVDTWYGASRWCLGISPDAVYVNETNGGARWRSKRIKRFAGKSESVLWLLLYLQTSRGICFRLYAVSGSDRSLGAVTGGLVMTVFSALPLLSLYPVL